MKNGHVKDAEIDLVITHIIPILGSYNAPHVRRLMAGIFGFFTDRVFKDNANEPVLYFPFIPAYARPDEHLLLTGLRNKLEYLLRQGWTPRQIFHLILGLARFAIIDDSVPSGAILEIGYARNAGTVTILLHCLCNETAFKSSWMTYDFEIVGGDDVITTGYLLTQLENIRETDLEEFFHELLHDLIQRAEQRLATRAKLFEACKERYRSTLSHGIYILVKNSNYRELLKHFPEDF